MSAHLERFAVALTRRNRRAAKVIAIVFGAFALAFGWWWTGARHAGEVEPGDWLDVLYSEVGAPHPRLSLSIAAMLGGLLGLGLVWLATAESGTNDSSSTREPSKERELGTTQPGPAVIPNGPIMKEPESTQELTDLVAIHDRIDETIHVWYPVPFKGPPHLKLRVVGGWADYEAVAEEPTGFAVRVKSVIGPASLQWTATGRPSE